jgi:hypothetical protein
VEVEWVGLAAEGDSEGDGGHGLHVMEDSAGLRTKFPRRVVRRIQHVGFKDYIFAARERKHSLQQKFNGH